MDTHKKIAKALVNKSFAEAKELVFKSLYAKASLALDEARFAVANGVFNAVEEDVEQIDELSKKTLGSYIRKASSDLARKTSDADLHNEYMGDVGTSKARLAQERKKISQRKRGIGQAVSRLTKEETEQLDEVSPPDMEKMTGSKKTKASFAKQYGKRGKSVMYATAWKLHNKKAGKD
jgi:hypothetical protein